MQNRHEKIIRKNLLQANKLQREGNVLAAERKYRSILKQQPRHRDAIELLGTLLQRRGKPASALHFMLLAQKNSPRNIQILINLAKIYRALKDVENTMFFARQALNLNKTHPEALAILGAVYYHIDRLPEALDCFSQSLKVNPDDESVREEYVNVCCSLALQEEQKSNISQAIFFYQQALETKPNHQTALVNLARLLISQQADQA